MYCQCIKDRHKHRMSTLNDRPPVRVLFVCLGNICRSPLAEGVFRKLVKERGLEQAFKIDSAGTGDWHVGESPDDRMQATAKRHGVLLHDQAARQIVATDLEDYDHVLVMDKDNHRKLKELAAGGYKDKIALFRTFDPDPEHLEVPDPYFGGKDGFENVYLIVKRTCQQLLDHLIEVHKLARSEQ